MAFPPSGYPAVDGVTPVVAADFNDVVAALQAHIGATVSFHGVSHVVTESNLEGLAQAIVGAMFAAGSHSGVSVSYNAGAGSISLSASVGGGRLGLFVLLLISLCVRLIVILWVLIALGLWCLLDLMSRNGFRLMVLLFLRARGRICWCGSLRAIRWF